MYWSETSARSSLATAVHGEPTERCAQVRRCGCVCATSSTALWIPMTTPLWTFLRSCSPRMPTLTRPCLLRRARMDDGCSILLMGHVLPCRHALIALVTAAACAASSACVASSIRMRHDAPWKRTLLACNQTCTRTPTSWQATCTASAATRAPTHRPCDPPVDPDVPCYRGDNIFANIYPGACGDYQYDFASVHSPGVFWLHPHKCAALGALRAYSPSLEAIL